MAFGNFATWAWLLLGAGPCTGNAEEKSWKLRASRSLGSVNKVAYPLIHLRKCKKTKREISTLRICLLLLLKYICFNRKS